MQNYRYYAVVTHTGEKKLFDDSRDYTNFKRANHRAINTRGFNNIADAQAWLNAAVYKPPKVTNLPWSPYPTVFDNPDGQNANTPINLFVWATAGKKPDNTGYYTVLLSSPETGKEYDTVMGIKETDPVSVVTLTTLAITHGLRLASDNGFRNVTVYTSSPHTAHWIDGTWGTDSPQGIVFLHTVQDLRVNKGMTIESVLTSAQPNKGPAELYAAAVLARHQAKTTRV